MSYTIDWRSNHFLRELHKLDSSGAALAVLWAYTTFADTEGHAWPNTIQLMAETAYSKPSVIAGRKILVEIGIIDDVDRETLQEDKASKIPPRRFIAHVNKQASINNQTLAVFYDPSYERRVTGRGPAPHESEDTDEPTVNEVDQSTVNDIDQEPTVNEVDQSTVNDIDQSSYINIVPKEHDSSDKESTHIQLHESSIQQDTLVRSQVAFLRFPGVRELRNTHEEVIDACIRKMKNFALDLTPRTLTNYLIWQVAVDWHDDIWPGPRLLDEGGFYPKFVQDYNAETAALLDDLIQQYPDWKERLVTEPKKLRAEMQITYKNLKEETITKVQKTTNQSELPDYIER